MSESNGLLDRMARIEGFQNEVLEALQAIGQVVGADEVQAKLASIKRDKMSQLVADAVKNGKLETSEVVTENSFLVGQQLGPTGTALFPGRFQLFTNEISETIRKDVVGKKVGEFVGTPDGGKIQVNEIYVPAEPKKAPVKKAKKARAPAPPISGVPN